MSGSFGVALLVGSVFEQQAPHQFAADAGDALFGGWRQARLLVRLRVAQDDPKSWTVDFVVSGADRSGELLELERVLVGVRQIEFATAGAWGSVRFVRDEI